MMRQKAAWSATENRIVEPYARAPSALRKVEFRLSPDAAFSDAGAYWLDGDDVPDPLVPELRLAVDEDAVVREAHLSVDDLRLVVVIRDRAARRWEAMQAYPLGETPAGVAFPPERLNRFAVARRLEFAVLIVPRYGLPVTIGRAWRPQHVVSERSFEINLRREGTRFPVRVREQKWFEENGYPADTVWTIDWQRRDPSASPAEALHIVVNERYAEHFEAALGSSDDQSALGHQIAAEIFAEVALVALREADEWPSDPDSLLGTVLGSLGVKDPSQLERYTNLVADPTDALPRLRGYAQSALALGKAMRKG